LSAVRILKGFSRPFLQRQAEFGLTDFGHNTFERMGFEQAELYPAALSRRFQLHPPFAELIFTLNSRSRL